eukprot:CAMPEP_0177636160 /NCGR_PEP_ID=MMETSP0447-20121125/4288_1 /TAXON_ID=0 /ORGANISM="Stygamoeba regulata, Strain BSH-02190019" /LENGTH=290 /DNA_ID=CAMNT_0019137999 /DNA_START=26 /DNA_END=898 /DNA_ORIENTATION=-
MRAPSSCLPLLYGGPVLVVLLTVHLLLCHQTQAELGRTLERHPATSAEDLAVCYVTSQTTAPRAIACLETWLPHFPHWRIYSEWAHLPALLASAAPNSSAEYATRVVHLPQFSASIGSAQRKFIEAARHCYHQFPTHKYFLLCDDDVFIVLPALLDFLAPAGTARDLNAAWGAFGDVDLILGGLMVFTNTAMRRMMDNRTGCIDSCMDTLAVHGTKWQSWVVDGAAWNADHLLSWCMQHAVGGFLVNAHTRIVFDGQPVCAAGHPGIVSCHHMAPDDIRAAYKRYYGLPP